jgi:hypothetical protein
MILRVGLVQTRTPATHAEALAHVAPLVRQAAEDGARLIVTPEGTNILQKDRERLLPVLTSVCATWPASWPSGSTSARPWCGARTARPPTASC